MAIPDFQSLMLPLLKLASDNSEHTVVKSRTSLADEFGLTQEEREELLPSGQQARFSNRIAWAKTYLERAGLLTSPRRGHFKITSLGLKVLENKPAKINIAFLQQFKGFSEFRNNTGAPTTSAAGPVVAPAVLIAEETPEESIQSAYLQVREQLATEILGLLRSKDFTYIRFEMVVLDVLLAIGYGGDRENAGSLTKKGGDEGIDGIINQDKLGLDTIYIQAKKWSNPVGSPEIQQFIGALSVKHARKGVFITTSSFTKKARSCISTGNGPKVILIDGEQLADLMIDHDVGVSLVRRIEIKRVDGDYFDGE